MNGYTIYKERQIDDMAQQVMNLYYKYNTAIENAKQVCKIPGWESEAGNKQKKEINAIISQAQSAAEELKKISEDLSEFTAKHKTWLENIEEAFDNLMEKVGGK